MEHYHYKLHDFVFVSTVQPSQCGWLKIKTSGRSGWRQVTDSNKQKQLFSEWLLWLMDELVVKLLKVTILVDLTHYYGIHNCVTEKYLD